MIKLRVVDEAGLPKEVEVSLTELQQLLDTGDPDPALEVWSDTLTQGQWKRLAELLLYKRAMAARDGGGSLAMRDITDRDKPLEEEGGKQGGSMWTCPKCGKEQQDTVQSCWYCNTDRGTVVAGPRVDASDSVGLPTRYGALRTIAGVFKVLAWVTLIGCALMVVITLAGAGKASSYDSGGAAALGALGVLAWVVAGAIGFVTFKATAESILVLIDIEENTRATWSLNRRTLDALNRLADRLPGVKQ